MISPNTKTPFIWKISRLLLFGIGFITIFMFFYSFIGIFIGLLFFLVAKDRTWKANGLVLAYSAAFSTWIVEVSKALPPLYLALLTGPVFFIGFIILRPICIRILNLLEKRGIISRKKLFGYQFWTRMNLNIKITLVLVLTVVPILQWGTASIDFGVLFNNSPQLLWIHGPTTVKQGQIFNITVESWDPYERLSAIYTGTVDFALESYNITTYQSLTAENVVAQLPTKYTFTGQTRGSDIAYEIRDNKDNGLHVFTTNINTTGIHYIKVSDSLSGKIYYSNPILIVDSNTENSMIYWGDFHTHSILSDGSGTPAHNFEYGRYVACLDYMALTDHGEAIAFQKYLLDPLEKQVNDEDIAGQFVVFQGMEWTSAKTGHYACIFSGDKLMKAPLLSTSDLAQPADLWNALDNFTNTMGCRALALPHHSTKKSYIQDWTYVNPKYVKIAEVSSVHGNFLYEQRDTLNYQGAIDAPPTYQKGTSITDALRMGYKLGLYSSSDTHDGHPGHSLCHTRAYTGTQHPMTMWQTRNEHPYPGGLTAVYADALTREAIFTGLENQRTYASTDHGRAFLNFSINGYNLFEGNEVICNNASAPREIYITVAQDGAPSAIDHQKPIEGANIDIDWTADIEVLKNGQLLQKIPITTPVAQVTLVDTSPIMGAVYGFQNCVQINGIYYINTYSNNPVDPTLLNTGGSDFYIVRVVAHNGRETTAGPIWVSY